MTLTSKMAIFRAEIWGKAPIAAPALEPMALKSPVDQAHIVLLDVLTRRSVTSSIGAMRL